MRVVPASGIRTSDPQPPITVTELPTGPASSARFTPFDLPVVPPVNIIGEPEERCSSSASPAESSQASYCGPNSTRSSPSNAATSSRRSGSTTTRRHPLSSRSAAISVAVKCQFNGTTRVPARALPRPNSAHSTRLRASTPHTSPSPSPAPSRARARQRDRCSTSAHDSTRSSAVTAGLDGSDGDSSRSGWSSPMNGEASPVHATRPTTNDRLRRVRVDCSRHHLNQLRRLLQSTALQHSTAWLRPTTCSI